jgi:hypothetical protein
VEALVKFLSEPGELAIFITMVAGVVFVVLALLALGPLVEHFTPLQNVGLAALGGFACAVAMVLK